MDKHDQEKSDWKWRYSPWTGIMYGPIPVGIIIVAIVAAFFMVYQVTK